MAGEQQIRFQWRGPPVPRAKPIPPEKWEEHREELCSQYQHMTLDQLMAMMKVKHNFTPSRRQYIHQFEKWHFNKYNANSAKLELELAESRQLFLQGPLHTNDAPTSGGEAWPQMQLLSDQATKRALSLREKPPVPPKKRKVVADFLSARDPYSHLALAFDSAKDAASSPQSLVLGAETAKFLGGASAWSGKRANQVVDSTSCLLIEDGCGSTSNDTRETTAVPPSEHSSFWGLIDFGQSQGQGPDENPFRREILVDSNRPIDTFSANEIADMKRAADFLKCLHCGVDAFSLYILILKWLRDSIDQPAWVRVSAMISCVQCAKTPAHIEIARGLLAQTLDETQGSLIDVERFLFRMLLAQTHICIGDDDIAMSHINAAMSASFANATLITCVPREHRMFDMITYHHLTGGLTDRLKNELLARTPPYVNKEDAQQLLLRNEPGPFELRDGFMKNPCLRSCLEWVVAELELLPSLSSAWQLGKTEGEKVSDVAEMLAIYCCLWERSQNCQTKHKSVTCLLWLDQTERRMGISAGELLRVICSLVMLSSPPGKQKSESELVLRAYKGAVSLSRVPDEQLACFFLAGFSRSRGMRSTPVEREAFRSVRSAYGKDFIGEKLWIRLPKVLRNAIEAPSARQSFEIVAAAFLPTIASSLHSSELASIRKIRDSMQRNVADAMQGVTITISSRASKRSPGSNRSFPTISMSELSQALSSSLNLSSTR